MILKVEKGLVNDDFIHNRVTIKALIDSGPNEYLVCKIYPDGRLMEFSGGFIPGDEYKEWPIDKVTADEIKSML